MHQKSHSGSCCGKLACGILAPFEKNHRYPILLQVRLMILQRGELALGLKMRTRILHARFAIRKSRPGLGHGLFATAPLKKGDFILEYTGKRISTPHADELPSRYLFEIDRKWTIDGSSRSNVARYINHSCSPNCEGDVRDERILIYATSDIAKGDELTINYGEEYFDEFIKPTGCKCSKCSEQITDNNKLWEVMNRVFT